MAKKRTGRQPFSQLLSYIPDTYLDRTSRPIYALVYLLGFIVLYEIGTLLMQPEALSQSLVQPQTRVVAFIWIKELLEYLGFTARMSWVATPLAVIIILLALQITSGTKWSIFIPDFIPMTIECIVLSIPLIVLSLLMNRSDPAAVMNAASAGYEASPQPQLLWMHIVTGIGAGIYEELIFRLILIGLLMLFFQDLFNMKKKPSIVLSVIISAVLFSLHHHVFFANGAVGTGEQFAAAKFIFRMLAGVYFAVLYAFRGYGITAGTHAFYDILAAVLMAAVFR